MTTLEEELAALRKNNDALQARLAEVEATLAARMPPALTDLHRMAEQWLNANMGDHWSRLHFDGLVALLGHVATPMGSGDVEVPTSTAASTASEDEVWVPDGEGGFVRTKLRAGSEDP